MVRNKQASKQATLASMVRARSCLDILFCAYLISNAELIKSPGVYTPPKKRPWCHLSAAYWLAHFIGTVRSLKSGNGIAFGARPNWSSPANKGWAGGKDNAAVPLDQDQIPILSTLQTISTVGTWIGWGVYLITIYFRHKINEFIANAISNISTLRPDKLWVRTETPGSVF